MTPAGGAGMVVSVPASGAIALLLPALLALRQRHNKQLRDSGAIARQRIADKCQRMAPHPTLFVCAVYLIAARHRCRRCPADQNAPVAAAIFTRMLPVRRDRAIRGRNADVSQVKEAARWCRT